MRDTSETIGAGSPAASPSSAKGFLAWGDTRKSLLLLTIAAIIDSSYLVIVAAVDRWKILEGDLDFSMLPTIRGFFWIALATYLTLIAAGAFFERSGKNPRVFPYLTMAVIGLNAIVNIFLMGSINTVGMAAVPVLVILAASVFGRRKAIFGAAYLAALIAIGFYLEASGTIPFSPIFRANLAPYYRSPLIYALSGGIVILFSVLGVGLVQLVEREREMSRAELRRANENLARTDQIKRQLLEACSQDLRSPAKAVVDYANTIEKSPEARTPEELLRACDALRQAGHLLLEHADNVLALSRSEFGQIRLSKSPVALESLTRMICDAYVPLAVQKHVHLVFDRGEGGALNRLDPLRVEQVASELVANAIRFCPEGSEVRVQVFDSGAFQTVEVENTIRDGAFSPMEFLGRAFSDDVPGERRVRGIGIAMCRMIVELHGGTIEARRSGENRICVAANFPVERPRVLLVTESDPERSMLRRQLALLGQRVFEAFEGMEAIREAQRVRPDLIVLDTEITKTIPAMEVLRRLKGGFLTKGIPVLLYTRDARSVLDAVREGCNDYILKPGDASELNQHIRMIFNR